MGSCKELSSGIGRRKTIKSVVMLIPAAMYQIVRLSRQRGARLGMKALTGLQANDTRMDCATFHETEKHMMMIDARWIQVAMKIRLYWRSRLILTQQRDQM